MTVDAYAPDGTPVEFFALLPAGDAPARIHDAILDGAAILELGAGAGRLTGPLVSLGHTVVAIDQSAAMLARITPRDGIRIVLADIEGLDLGRTFPVVLLASYLINTADELQRDAFLATCRSHLDTDGILVVQRYDTEWARTAEPDTSERDGFEFELSDIVVGGDDFAATMTYRHEGRQWEQPFGGRILDDEALAAVLGKHGLVVVEWLDEFRTWCTVRRPALDEVAR